MNIQCIRCSFPTEPGGHSLVSVDTQKNVYAKCVFCFRVCFTNQPVSRASSRSQMIPVSQSALLIASSAKLPSKFAAALSLDLN